MIFNTVFSESEQVVLTGFAKNEQTFNTTSNQNVPVGGAVSSVNGKTGAVVLNAADVGAQPAGDYLTEVPVGYATEEYVKNKIAEAELGGEEVDLSGYAKKSELPTKLSDLGEDSTHRVVTDAEKAAWSGKSNFSGNYADLNGKPTIPTVPTKVSAFENDKGYLTQHQDISGKLDASKLPDAIDDALAQAKESGEFDGEDGYTPVKGVDYYTPDDKAEIMAEVIESLATSEVPAYVVTEAERVADAVKAVRTSKSMVLLCASDIHTLMSNAQSMETTLHLAQGMNEICKRVAVDGIAILGDSATGGTTSTVEDCKAEIDYLRENLGYTQGVPQIWMAGNHDHNSQNSAAGYLTGDELYAHIGANTTDKAVTDYDNLHRMYGYMDYDKQRIRVIYLNTSDITDSYASDYGMTTVQAQWLVDTLAAVPDGWGVVVMSHHPLNGSTVTGLLTILDAYKGKESGSVSIGNTISYDFTAAKGEFICHLHGHLHNYQVKKLGTNGVLSITIPNGYFWRNNEYGLAGNTEWGDEVNGEQRVINKTAGTAEDTAYTAVVIDRKNGKIHALRCGAGIDRICDYANVEPEQPETITIDWKDGYRFSSSSGSQSAQAGMTCGYLPMTDLAVDEGYKVTGLVFDNAAHSNTYCTAYENDAYTSKYYALTKGQKNIAFATYYTLTIADDGSYFEIIKTSAPTDGDTLKVGIAGYGVGADAVVTKVSKI